MSMESGRIRNFEHELQPTLEPLPFGRMINLHGWVAPRLWRILQAKDVHTPLIGQGDEGVNVEFWLCVGQGYTLSTSATS